MAHTRSPEAAVEDPAWTAAQLTPDACQVQLQPEESAALAGALATERPWHELGRRDVPRATGALWARIEHCLERSAGFCVVSGYPFDGSEDHARRLTFLTGHALGTPVFQDAQGARIVDIRSTDANLLEAGLYKPRSDGTHVRPYETRVAFRLHADACDVAGLFCVQAAASGGESSIVNALALHQRLTETRPDLLQVLAQPFFYVKPRRAGEAVSWHGIPVFSWHEGYFKSHIVPDLIFLSQLTPEVPRLSAAQREALDVLMGLASAAEFKLDLRLEPGQMLLTNNHLVWHGRAAYEDAEGTVRHLLRLWLATPRSRPLHPVHEAWFGNPSAGALRGGYLRERLGELAERDRA